MRISIKYKLPLIILSIFLLFVLFIYTFYLTYAVKSVRYKLDSSSQKFTTINEQLSEGIAKRYPDMAAIRSYIDGMSKQKNITVTVSDLQGNLVYKTYTEKRQGLRFRTRDVAVVNGNAVYKVEVEHAYLLLNIFGIDIVKKVISFSIVVLFVLLIPFMLFLHFDIVKPLELLRSSLSTVGYQTKSQPLRLKRKDEIGELSKNFDEMVKKLDASYNEQVEIISSISHDLKTPLTSILGYMERLMAGKAGTEEKRQEYYSIIYKKAQDISILLEEFSEFTNNETETEKMNWSKVPVSEFFTAIAREYEEELQAYNTAVEVKMSLEGEPYMEADVQQLRRVFANLISNSVKYGEAPLKLMLGCSTVNNNICFAVEDNGSGIPEQELENIFNKFYRVEKSRSPEKGGVGLGLAICKKIIGNHNGTIEAYNIKKGGLGIRFCIPAVKR